MFDGLRSCMRSALLFCCTAKVHMGRGPWMCCEQLLHAPFSREAVVVMTQHASHSAVGLRLVLLLGLCHFSRTPAGARLAAQCNV